MRRWLNNLPILAKAFAAPALLLLCLLVLGTQSYVVTGETANGLTAISQSSLPKRSMVGSLTRQLADAHILLLRYVSWLNSGVDKERLRQAEREIAERNQTVAAAISAVMLRPDLDEREHRILQKIEADWSRYRDLTGNSVEVGAVQPSMAVMMLGEADDLFTSLRSETDAMIRSVTSGTERFAGTMVDASRQSQQVLLGGMAVAIPLSVIISIIVALSIARPVQAVTEVMQAISRGQLDVDIEYAGRSDEIGRMVKAIAVFRQNAAEVRALEERQRAEQRSHTLARRTEMEALAADLEASVKSIASHLKETAARMHESSAVLAESAGKTRGQSVNIGRIFAAMSDNVRMVAETAQQMAASIREVSHQVVKTGDLVKFTAAETQRAGGEIEELTRATDQITSILDLIQGIAAKTNLLALNATIEAARAGGVGKGFAVVAAEVKLLANQTGRATDDISARIAAVRSSCSAVVASMGSIIEAIRNVEALSSAMAAAVDEQAAATGEIASSAGSASASVQQVSEKLSQLTEAANETDQASKTVRTGTQNLLSDADTVNAKVDRFLAHVRAA
jgi:methyl-accepting chemotaxis protein